MTVERFFHDFQNEEDLYAEITRTGNVERATGMPISISGRYAERLMEEANQNISEGINDYQQALTKGVHPAFAGRILQMQCMNACQIKAFGTIRNSLEEYVQEGQLDLRNFAARWNNGIEALHGSITNFPTSYKRPFSILVPDEREHLRIMAEKDPTYMELVRKRTDWPEDLKNVAAGLMQEFNVTAWASEWYVGRARQLHKMKDTINPFVPDADLLARLDALEQSLL